MTGPRRRRSRTRLSEDLGDWSRGERRRFWASLLLLLMGTAATAVLLVPWVVVPLATAGTALCSRRCRDALKELCYLAAALNVLAGFYALLLLPGAVLLVAAGLVAPDGVVSRRRRS